MKEVITASIAGIAFNLDADAYTKIDQYLKKIKVHYGNSIEGKEIISDIEARIAEIILSRQENTKAVSEKLIDEIIAQLGMPDDIAGKDMGNTSFRKSPRRLYRNLEGAKLAGVCNGMATFLNTDASLVRLIFLLPFVLAVVFSVIVRDALWIGVLFATMAVYITLWIIIPKARTPLQKLEMQGENITTSKIEETFRETFSDIENNISRRTSPKSEKNASVFTDIVSLTGKIILICVKVALALIAFGFIAAIVGILVAVSLAVIPGVALVAITPPITGKLLIGLTGLLAIIPLGLMLNLLISIIINRRIRKWTVITAVVGWILTLAAWLVIAIGHVGDIRVNGLNLNELIEEQCKIEYYLDGVRERKTSYRVKDGRYQTDKNIISTDIQMSSDTLYIKPARDVSRDDEIPEILIIHGDERVEGSYISISETKRRNMGIVTLKSRFSEKYREIGESVKRRTSRIFDIEKDTLFLRKDPYDETQREIKIFIPKGEGFKVSEPLKYTLEER